MISSKKLSREVQGKATSRRRQKSAELHPTSVASDNASTKKGDRNRGFSNQAAAVPAFRRGYSGKQWGFCAGRIDFAAELKRTARMIFVLQNGPPRAPLRRPRITTTAPGSRPEASAEHSAPAPWSLHEFTTRFKIEEAERE